jgi:hypothetical protein
MQNEGGEARKNQSEHQLGEVGGYPKTQCQDRDDDGGFE